MANQNIVYVLFCKQNYYADENKQMDIIPH